MLTRSPLLGQHTVMVVTLVPTALSYHQPREYYTQQQMNTCHGRQLTQLTPGQHFTGGCTGE